MHRNVIQSFKVKNNLFLDSHKIFIVMRNLWIELRVGYKVRGDENSTLYLTEREIGFLTVIKGVNKT